MNMNEEEKMKAGRSTTPMTTSLVVKREKAHILCRHYNSTDEHMVQERRRILLSSSAGHGGIRRPYGTHLF